MFGFSIAGLVSKLLGPVASVVAVILGVLLVLCKCEAQNLQDRLDAKTAEIERPETPTDQGGWRAQLGRCNTNVGTLRREVDEQTARSDAIAAEGARKLAETEARLANSWREYERANQRAGAAEARAAQLRAQFGSSTCEAALQFMREQLQ